MRNHIINARSATVSFKRINFKMPKPSPLNNSGVILVTVLMLTFVLSIVVLGILGLYVSQVKSSQSVVDKIKAEQLAVGTAYRTYQCKEWQCPLGENPSYSSQVLDGKSFSIAVDSSEAAVGGLGKHTFTIGY
jgi:hypothetical protein